MARLFFDVAGAGLADGSNWNNRAPMLVSGVCNTLVTAFDYTSNFLEVVVDPGTYTFTANPVFTGTSVPSRNFPCIYLAGDGAGGLWQPPNLNWRSVEPAWNDAAMPIFTHSSGNLSYFGQSGVAVTGMVIESVNTTTRVLNGLISVDWCIINHNGSHANAFIYVSGAIQVTNSVLRMNGTAYAGHFTGSVTTVLLSQVRLEGNPSASSGTRHGWTTGSNAVLRANRITIIGNPGTAINQSGAGSAGSVSLESIVLYGNGAGVLSNGTATIGSRINGSVICNNTAEGVNMTNTNQMLITNSRLRNNSTNLVNVNMAYNNDISAGTDSDEFVNVSGAVSTWDLRIKNTSSKWGMGYGGGDQPASGGAGGLLRHPGMNGGFAA